MSGQNPSEDSQVSVELASPPSSLQDNGFTLLPLDETSAEEVERLKEELKTWKIKVEEAENAKENLLQSKLSAELECDRAEKELTKLKEQEEQCKARILTFERELSQLNPENAELKKKIEKLQGELGKCNSQGRPMKKKVAEMKLKFTHLEDIRDGCSDMDTCCVFETTAKIPFRLKQNQALLTFEDEEVAQRVTEKSKHTVNLDNRTADVTVKPYELEMGFKLELHAIISGKKIDVSEIPELSIPDVWMRDKLELNFYKTMQGGGEIEDVTYHRESGTAVITFLSPGASNNFVRCPEYLFCVEEMGFDVYVSPHVDYHLEKFQPYRGVSKKTILLKGIPDMGEDEESVQDMIEIHFQKPSNGGGEIEKIKYTSRETACVCFEEDTENST